MMKKILALCTAVLLCTAISFGGCGKQAAPAEASTEPAAPTQQTEAAEDDLALPDVNESGSTTAPVVTPATTAAPVVAQPAPIMQAIAEAQNAAPATTAATTTTEPQTEPQEPESQQSPGEATAPAKSTTAPTAAPTTAPTTQAAGKPDMLNNYVLKHINSGTYTETISAFGKDQCPDDKLSKIVRGGETAYYITIPAAGLGYKVFPNGGKYYLATSAKYCELTRAQYDSICGIFGNAFFNFSVLQYQKTDTVRDGLKKYTCEYFDVGGNTFILWYNNNALSKVQMGSETLPMTVSGTADAAYFSLGANLEKTDYATLESLVSLAGAFFGA